MANARAKSEQADQAAEHARQDSDIARLKGKEYAPDFHQPGTDILKKKLQENPDENYYSNVKLLPNHNSHQRSKSMMVRKSNRDENHDLDSSLSALSSALDCALPGSYNPGYNTKPDDGIHYLSVSYENQNQNQNPEHVATTNTPHNRSPSLKIRRYSFLAGSRRGRGFSELFNSTILNDHFDQYSSTQRDDSGLGKELCGEEDRQRINAHASDTSPDSGVSETMEDDSKHRPLQRRRTLPCIIKTQEENPKLAEKDTAHSSENLAGKIRETYIIENGIRKRIKEHTHEHADPKKGELIREFMLESQKKLIKKRNPGSLPDINIIKQLDLIKPMPREEAYKLSSQRREELRQLQELEERRKQGDVAVILGDLKDWCQQRQLLVLLIALNVSLATMFFNLLS